ncbi:alpha/beta-hydrolase [Decorospora gaudefroyi]|uniref:Alpha/beta-hydrolase n=1 Tax=Decorospora gaudefroyi TaxID=184978 RepID=A0A6A5KSX0_9PLEO|nr:alpha/beta-hydrolase [Decorospora gaudefroyi]
MAKPTILIVPGSFAPSTMYDEVVRLLKAKGYPAVAVELPSTTKRMPLEPATMMEDADVVKRAAETLIGLGKEVIVIPHSYGGVPTMQGLAGIPVKKIICMSAVVPTIGQTQIEAMGQDMPPMPPVTAGYLHLDPILLTSAACNDMPWEDGYPVTLQLAHQSAASFEEKVTQVAYADKGGAVPVAYIVCEQDLIISPGMQRKYVDVVQQATRTTGATARPVDVYSLDAGHIPNASCPAKLVEGIVWCAEK